MWRSGSSAFVGPHKIKTPNQAPRLRQDRAREAIIGPFLENRRMAKAVMIPQGNGLLKEAIIHLGREPRSKSANRGLAHLSRGFVWARSVSRCARKQPLATAALLSQTKPVPDGSPRGEGI